MRTNIILIIIALLLCAEGSSQEKESNIPVSKTVGLPLSEFITFTFNEGKLSAISTRENNLGKLLRENIKVPYDVRVLGRCYTADLNRGLDQFLHLLVDARGNIKFAYEQEKPLTLSIRVSRSEKRTRITVEDDSQKIFVRFIQKEDSSVELVVIDRGEVKFLSADDFVSLQLTYPSSYENYFVSILQKYSLEPPFSLLDMDVISMTLSGLDSLPEKDRKKLDALISQLDDKSTEKQLEARNSLTGKGIHALRAIEETLKRNNISPENRAAAESLARTLTKYRHIEQYVKSVQLDSNIEYLKILLNHEDKEVRKQVPKKLVEAAEKYLATLPSPQKRTKKQRQKAKEVRILFAHAAYELGDYRTAAKQYDTLLKTVRCPKCGYEEVLGDEDLDKPLRACPKCKNEEVRLEKTSDGVLEISEGAARSYLAIYEELNKKDTICLNRAQDIYQRMFKQLDQIKQQDKYWEIAYTIIKIWFYKGDYNRIIGEVKSLLAGLKGLEPPSEDDWKMAIPVKHWRDKIMKIFIEARKQPMKDK